MKILRALFTKSISIVILIMVAFSLYFHTLELKRINKILTRQTVNNPESGIDVSKTFMNQLWNELIYGEDTYSEDSSGYCMEITFNGTRIVKPLAATVYGYTYAYLMYYIEKYHLISNNIPIVVLFPTIAFADFAFQYYHKCRPKVTQNILAFILGSLWGINWADLISGTGNSSLQYFVGSKQPVCSVPTSQNFVCNVYKNGQIIAKL
jgi:hypothetical protein